MIKTPNFVLFMSFVVKPFCLICLRPCRARLFVVKTLFFSFLLLIAYAKINLPSLSRSNPLPSRDDGIFSGPTLRSRTFTCP